MIWCTSTFGLNMYVVSSTLTVPITNSVLSIFPPVFKEAEFVSPRIGVMAPECEIMKRNGG